MKEAPIAVTYCVDPDSIEGWAKRPREMIEQELKQRLLRKVEKHIEIIDGTGPHGWPSITARIYLR